MDFLRVISFSFMVSTSFGNWIPGFNTPAQSPVSEHVCPVSDQLPAFLQQLEPDHLGIERLVVFVYRKIGTEELMTYIPSGQYQKCIRNYPETPGDKVFRLNTITIANLLQNSDHKPIRITEQEFIPQEKEDDKNAHVAVVDDDAWKGILEDCTGCIVDKPLDSQNVEPVSESDQHDVIAPLPMIPVEVPEKGIPGVTDNVNQGGGIKLIIDGPPENWDGQYPNEVNDPSQIIFPGQWANPVSLETNVNDTQGQVKDPENQIPKWEQIVSEGPENKPKEVIDPGMIFFPSQDISINTNLPSSQQSTEIAPPGQHTTLHQPPIEQWNYGNSGDTPNPDVLDLIPPSLLQNVAIHRPTDNVGNLMPSFNWSPLAQHLVPQHVPGYTPSSNLVSQLTHWQLVHAPNRLPSNNQFNSYFWAMNHPKIKKKTDLKDTAQKDQKPSDYGSSFDSWLMTQLNVIKSEGQGMPSSALDIGFVRRKIEEALQYHGYTVTKNGLLVDQDGVASSLSNLKLRPILIGKSFEYHNLLTDNGKYQRPVTPLIEGLLLSLIKPPKVLGMVTLGLTWAGNAYFDGNNRVHVRREWRVPEVQNTYTTSYILGKRKLEKPSGIHGWMQTFVPKVVANIDGLQHVSGGGGHVTVAPMDITPGFRIIGGSSAMGTGTPLMSKGRSGEEELNDE